jgi:hypothetical protein
VAATKVVIVYSPNQGMRRTVIIPSDDSQVPIHTANLQPGEAVMVGSLSDYRWNYGPDKMLARYLGRQPTTDRCAVVNSAGYVVGLLKMDPALDRPPPLCRLHRDPNGVAVVGQLAMNLPLTP